MDTGTNLLPRVEDRAGYCALFPQIEQWLPAIEAIRRREDLPGPLVRSRSGGNILFRAGEDAWIKLVAPLFQDEIDVEAQLLDFVGRQPAAVTSVTGRAGPLPVAVPRIRARGEIEGWSYLVLDHVDGVAVRDLWPRLDRHRQLALARDLGALSRRLSEIPAAGIGALPAREGPRLLPPFDGVVAHHRATGLPEGWLGAIPDFLARTLGATAESPEWQDASTPVLLHADLTPDHILLASEEDPRIVGLIDFADALVGPAEYEFCAPGVHLLRGDGEGLHAYLDGYGWSPDRRGDDQSRRMLAWWILHRFANLPRIVPAALEALPPGDLDALAARCFPLARA